MELDYDGIASNQLLLITLLENELKSCCGDGSWCKESRWKFRCRCDSFFTRSVSLVDRAEKGHL